jgi:hypothetical protein
MNNENYNPLNIVLVGVSKSKNVSMPKKRRSSFYVERTESSFPQHKEKFGRELQIYDTKSCDKYGRDIELRVQFETAAADSHSDFPEDVEVIPDYGFHETKFFKINIKTGKREYRGRQYYM